MRFALLIFFCALASAETANFGDIFSVGTSPPGPFRWVDAADQAYAAAYRNSYDYSEASVSVEFAKRAPRFAGTLTATGLKPNFAYQLKLVGDPSRDSNEWIGYAGRWWRETWNGSAWANGWNLNSKGNGSFPNPNDITYQDTRDTPSASSPTGKLYRYQGYLLLTYFITDSAGVATLDFEADSSYHVLWKTTQRSPVSSDGPLVTAAIDPDPAEAAYDADYAAKSVSIFGEWERLPAGGIFLPDGEYGATLVLTEESFHGSGGTYAGFWAGAMSAWIEFSIGSGPTLSSFTTSPIRGAGPSADRLVNVALSASADASGWWIGESEEPGTWLDSQPDSYTIIGNPGPITLYARVRDAAGVISDPLTAALVYEPPRELRISLDGETVTLGQWSAASDAFDPDFDSPAEPGAIIWLGDRLRHDFRSRDQTRWRLHVDQPGELSWDLSDAEPAKWLLLQAVDGDRVPSASPVALHPGETWQIASAGDYLLLYDLPQVHPLPTRSGWQLIGASVHTPSTLGELFPGADIWRWQYRYEPCLPSDGLFPGAGYWLYQIQASDTILGIPAAGPIRLHAGWNLIAVAESATLDRPEVDAVWGWQGRFRKATTLAPGVGYWVHASIDLIVP
jgi:hypothetical protein